MPCRTNARTHGETRTRARGRHGNAKPPNAPGRRNTGDDRVCAYGVETTSARTANRMFCTPVGPPPRGISVAHYGAPIITSSVTPMAGVRLAGARMTDDLRARGKKFF